MRESFWKIVLPLLFGFVSGVIPGAIKFDQLHREVQAEREATEAQMSHLRELANQNAERVADEKLACDAAILGDGARTILVDTNHPYGDEQQQLLGAALTLPPAGNPAFATGPIWVVPRAITPHVVDGVLGAAYTHIWPDGRTDGWHMPARAQ